MKTRIAVLFAVAYATVACDRVEMSVDPVEITSGTRLTYEVADDAAVGAVAEVVTRRLEDLEVPFRLTIRPDDGFDVLLEERDERVLGDIEAVIARPGRLEFLIVADEAKEAEERRRREEMGEEYPGPPEGYAWCPSASHRESGPASSPRLLRLPGSPAETFTSEDVDPDSLDARRDFRGTGYLVVFEIAAPRVGDFERFTEKNVKRKLAIVIDGEVESAPIIQEKLPGRGIISGGGANGFSREEAETLVTLLKCRPLASDVILKKQVPIGETGGD